MTFPEARILSIVAQIEAVKVRVISMQVANEERFGKAQAQAYPEAEFYKEAQLIDNLAAEIHGLSERL